MVKFYIDWYKEIRVGNDYQKSVDQSVKLGPLTRFVGQIMLIGYNEDEAKCLKTLPKYYHIIKSKTTKDKYFVYQNGSGLPVINGGHMSAAEAFEQAHIYLTNQIEFLLSNGEKRTGKERA